MKNQNKNNQLELVNQEDQTSPANLLKIAIENKADITQLKELMDLQDRYLAQIAKKNFLKAISDFQLQCPAIKKKKKVSYTNSKGYQTKYNFADLGEIEEAIKKPIHDNGLSKRWELSDKGELLECVCIISHVDGHSEKTSMSASKDDSGGKNAIQMRGSAISYLKRYTLTSALGITTADDDDDGKLNGEQKQENPKEEVANTNALTPGDEAQIREELLLLNTEFEVMNYACQWDKYKNNAIVKGMYQKRVSQLPQEARMKPSEKKSWKRPTIKK